VYVWHDTVAKEVDEKKFYKYRYGGGTTCSTALKLISKMFENRYNPIKWNIYLFYFTDGENWDNDNEVFCDVLEKEFGGNVVNMVGITQILPWQSENSLKQYVDDKCGNKNMRTTQIGSSSRQMSDEERDAQIKNSIIELLGRGSKKENYWANALG